jgi:8-oxo-dGTP diphosphatase
MTAIVRATAIRKVYFHDPLAPAATLVVPTAFVAVRGLHGSLLLVRRCDSGAWELPGGRVEVGESAADAAVRETAEETGVQVTVTGFVGLFTDPGHVVRGVGGQVRQQFVLLLRARPVGGAPRGDQQETSAAAWVPVGDLPSLEMEPAVCAWLDQVLVDVDDDGGAAPHLG